VQFFDGATSLGTVPLSGLSAQLSTAALTVTNGTVHSITAKYLGDSNFEVSTSPALLQVVNKAATSTAVVSSVNPSVYGQSVIFTATVSVVAPGAGTPSGSVQFFDGATSLGTVPLSGLSAQLSTAALTVTNGTAHSITAKYLGDSNFEVSTSPALLQVVNKRATSTTLAFAPASILEGQSSVVTVTVTDTDTGTQSAPTGTVTFSSDVASDTFSPTNACVLVPNAGTASCTVTVNTLDNNGVLPHTITASYPGDSTHLPSPGSNGLAVANVPPSITSITGPAGPLALGSSASVTANFVDPGGLDTHTCTFSWDDAATPTTNTVEGSIGSGSCMGTFLYQSAGVYTITVTVTDKDGGTAISKYEFVVVYDPSAGFVTGGGWINSPAGAYVPNSNLAGKANFGFVSKYQKGAAKPTGETEFQFHVASFNFHSAEYDWLVVAGAKAQYKGTGTVNGTGNYGFLLTATDGQVNGGGGVDKFRIKIVDKSTGLIVYDNGPASSDDIDEVVTQAIAGGSIVIHSK
jgi:hypothetical protein